MSEFSFSPLIEAEISVGGMTCGHCKMKVEKALSMLPEVNEVTVDLIDGTAEITLNKQVSDKTFKVIVEGIGFKYLGRNK